MVNPDVKPENTLKNGKNNLLKTKIIPKPKYKLSGGDSPLSPRELCHWL